MKHKPIQSRAIAKIDKLLAAACESFSEDGYEATTSKSIAARAGVATGTFYQYFENKDDILREIARKKFDSQEKAVYQQPAGEHWDDLTALIEEVLHRAYAFNAEEVGLHQIIEHRRTSDPELAQIVDTGEARILALVRRFVASYGVDDPDTAAFTVFSMAEGVIHRHALVSTSDVAKDDALRTAAQILSCYFTSLERSVK